QHDGGLDYLSPYFIGYTRNGTFYHRGVGHYGALHLEGTDAVTGALDYIIGATHEPVVAILIAPGHITGAVEVVGIDAVRQRLITVIAHKKPQGALFMGIEDDLSL